MKAGDLVSHKKSSKFAVVVETTETALFRRTDSLVKVLFVGCTKPRYVLENSLKVLNK
tara:strand:- start:13361 stop:13534 length:174 start_codon:yes stop_codon:yes gene_type:complete